MKIKSGFILALTLLSPAIADEPKHSLNEKNIQYAPGRALCIPTVTHIQGRPVTTLYDQQNDKTYFVPELEMKQPVLTLSQDSNPQMVQFKEHGSLNFQLAMSAKSQEDWEILKKSNSNAVNILDSAHFRGVEVNGEKAAADNKSKPTIYSVKFTRHEADIAAALAERNTTSKIPIAVFTDPCEPMQKFAKQVLTSGTDRIRSRAGGIVVQYSPYPPEVLFELLELEEKFLKIPRHQLEQGDLHKRELLYRALEAILKHPTERDLQAMKIMGFDNEHILHYLTYALSNEELSELSQLPFLMPLPQSSVIAYALKDWGVGRRKRLSSNGDLYVVRHPEDGDAFHERIFGGGEISIESATNDDIRFKDFLAEGKVKKLTNADVSALGDAAFLGKPSKSLITRRNYFQTFPKTDEKNDLWERSLEITPFQDPVP